MHCSRARTALSARLDGEALPPGVTEQRLDEHLAGCPACARWGTQATQLGRMAADEPRSRTDSAERLTERLRGSDGQSDPGNGGSGRQAG
ncbi:MAG TPA: zf-HC2 domain-containing protein [Streptomyces sp.]|nr:zf-HC2 domain-containing protein [Streptomyces sp.]